MATKLIMTMFLVLDQGGSIGTLGTPIFDTNTLPQSLLPVDQPHDLLIRNTVLGDALARSFSNDSSVRLVFSSSFHPNLPNFKYLRLPQASPPSPFSLLSFLLLMSRYTLQLVLMKGHGMALRGASVRDAVFRSFYAREDAMVQLQSIQLGGPHVMGLTAREAHDGANTTESESLCVYIFVLPS